jgi:hypothetical protein
MTSDPPPAKHGCIAHINFSLESLYPLKKPHQNPLGSFEDLCLHRDRQRVTTCFILSYDYDAFSSSYEELDGRAVCALGVGSRKLSTGLNAQS